MFYKSKNISFQSEKTSFARLCFSGEYYYFESEKEIETAEIISSEEFESVFADAVYKDQEETAAESVMDKLDRIETKIQTNEDLQTFYDDIVKEVGL